MSVRRRLDKEETLTMIGENTDNPTIREAASFVRELSEEEKLRKRLFDRQSAINDYNNDMTRSRAVGREARRMLSANKATR